ncbi:sugar-binding transcriptional regulator [Ralstonia pseudosolanacearum]|uniref:Transcriptional regulator of mannitol utilization, DeoR family protein n=1 Tax=Ralstonia solanacearum TaxID=305 RepID=A0A0S4VZE1_RALSL|nr:Transcriptional regulator of mannitol utilization, DeoR family protein [Ralstonia solanacearum]BEU51164.1 sugar-binding transcriptional regulator [Ralstonia pseudosolanacearum]CUV34735.1 Transcriptional regulator of mannitol utilization, DeoR family protein [Ralstonia solanacearum]CUV39875.1 Transcriptional regulator of mannitol utilization, DeoR family protein [Ralstonia solanacearum]CUV44525.1 Transcriptional regulator of mannitol utilization, DeoR family protein [Ralstonia solanacearum]
MRIVPVRRPDCPSTIVPKPTEKLDLATRAAWLYYIAGDTQNEIAEKLQVSRPVAQRLVAFAVEKNLIRVRVDHRLADCLDLGARLSKRYGLSMCEVVPVDADAPEAIDRKLAVAGAQVMEFYLNETRPMVIAISSGRTLKAAVAQIAQIERPQHRLVSMVGAIAPDGASNRYDVAQAISEKTGGKHFLLPAPLFADSDAERAQWCNHRLYRIVESLSAEADVAFVGIGNIAPQCPLFEDGFITAEELDELISLGAVAEMLGIPIDAHGQRVTASTSARVTSVPLHAPPERPTIAIAGGPRKRDAVIAALRGGWLSGLVTDETCARAALEA